MLVLLLVFTSANISAFAATNHQPPFIGRVNITNDSLNMRDGPGFKKHAVVGEVKKGQEVEVLSSKPCDDGSTTVPWYYIRFVNENGVTQEGYISSNPVDYVRDLHEPPYIGKAVTEGGNLNVRSGPGTKKYGKIGIIANGAEVTVKKAVPCDDGSTADKIWFFVEFTENGQAKTGYVASKYIEYVRDISSPPDPPKPPVPEPGKPTPPVQPGTVLDHTAPMPDFYKPYLAGIMQSHPNWKFEFYDTGLDWNVVIEAESKPWSTSTGWHSKSLIPRSFPLSYRWDSLQNVPIEGSSWYAASAQTVSYFMDPRNSMTYGRLFQFEAVSYNPDVQTIAGVEKMLKGTYMEGKTIKATDGRMVTYAQAIMEAAKDAWASPYFIASRIIQETGYKGSGSVSGTYPGHEGYYNFYNIGAGTKGDTVANALDWAASTDANETKNAGRPWTTPYQSIVEGAKWISRSYIAKGQDTLYYQKFDLVPPKPFGHQYMTNVSAPYSEAVGIYKNYRDMGMLDYPFVFRLPVYRNMPSVCHLADFGAGDYYKHRRGDANMDGNLSLADYQLLKDHAKEWDFVTGESQEFIQCDLNDDMAIDAFDAALLDRLINS